MRPYHEWTSREIAEHTRRSRTWAHPPRPRRPVCPTWVVVLVIALVALAAGHVVMQAVQDFAHFYAIHGG